MSDPRPESTAGKYFTAARRKDWNPFENRERGPTCSERKSHAIALRERARGWLRMEGVTRNNLKNLSVAFPLGTLIAVTGVSGSGKSSLVSQALVELVGEHLGHSRPSDEVDADPLSGDAPAPSEGRIIEGLSAVKRLVQVDQKPIGRTPRSNLATYTGLFDYVRRIFAETKAARARRYTAGRFSFNVAQGRCETCEGEGFVCVELLFMPSVYAPCSTCHGARYNAKTLEIQYRGKNIAEVLAMTVDGASEFFAEQPQVSHALTVLQEVGLGYLRLGQPATELSGGEAQRIKLATELQRNQRGNTLYVLDEPTTGLHPSDVQRLVAQLDGLVELGNTVIVVEHDLDVVAASDYVIDMGPGAGEAGGAVVACGTPAEVATSAESRTAVSQTPPRSQPLPGTQRIESLRLAATASRAFSVRNVIDQRGSLTGGMLCCHSSRATPLKT